MSNQDGYKKLLVAVLGVQEEDILLLRDSDLEMIEEMLGGLSSKRAAALRLRFGLGDEEAHTLKTAGKRIGITGETVRMRVIYALFNLRHPSRKRHLLRLTNSSLEAGETAEPLRPLLERSVEELEMSSRAYTCIRNLEIKTIGELAQKKDFEVLMNKNFGRKSLNELEGILKSFGLRFGMTPSELKQFGR
jgi:hypothetical protein